MTPDDASIKTTPHLTQDFEYPRSGRSESGGALAAYVELITPACQVCDLGALSAASVLQVQRV